VAESSLRSGRAALCAALFLLTWAVYLDVGGCGFVFDDGAYFFENRQIRSGLTPQSVTWAFTSSFGGNWFPATLLSHLLDVELFGISPAGHHLTNVLLHAINAVLLFLWLDSATGAVGRSFFVAALFAVHPLHVESVAWVSARKDLLSTLFGLLALRAYAGYVRQPRLGNYLAVAGWFVLSLLSKSMLVTLPFLLLLLDWWPLGRLRPPSKPAGLARPALARLSRRRLVLEKVPLFALAALSSGVAFFTQQQWGATVTTRYYAFPARAANALVAYGSYLLKTVWPAKLAVFYPHLGPSIPRWQWIAAAAVLAALTALALAKRRGHPALLTGWFWYLGTLVPVIGLLQVGSQAMADRYTYLPLVGVFLLAAWELPRSTTRIGPAASRPWAAAGACAVVVLAVLSWAQVRVWKNNLTLFAHAARVVPGNWFAQIGVGLELERLGRVDEAATHFVEALRTNYYAFEPHARLAAIFDKRGALAGAVRHYRMAVMLEPGNAELQRRYAAALARQNRMKDALAP